jgi:hypothetical protein
MALAFAVVSAFTAILVALGNVSIGGGNALIFDVPQPLWILLLGAGACFLIAYGAAKIGLGLLRKPEIGRKAGELAMWLGILTVWLTLAAVNLLLTEGADDVFVWPVLAAVGVLSSAVLVGAALYMRSERARSYFLR